MLNIAAGNPVTGYNLSRSLRFRASASASLSRTPASAGNRQKWTWSGWIKRGALGTNNCFFSQGNNIFVARFNNNTDVLEVYDVTGGPYQLQLITSQVFRDPSAWYHLVIATDTTQATASNRVKIYLNGTQITAFSTATYYSQNYNTEVNTTDVTNIGALAFVGQYFDGYLAEVNFIDGQALTPTSFGSYSSTTGVWQPARYSGTYGTNGFYLPFTDNSALTTSSNVGLGKDFSGNGNYWTTNNISITSGITYDSMTDVPTLTSATAANFCTWNPLSNTAGSLTNGNLTFNGTAGVAVRGNSTFAVSSGKWYFESTLTTADTFTVVGIGQGFITNQYPGFDALSYVQTLENATSVNNNVVTSYGSVFVAGDVFMCAFDLDNNKIFFGKNGTWFNSSNPAAGTNPAYTITAGTYSPIARPYGSGVVLNSNFGQRPFAYTPPTSYVALNTYNLPTSTIVKGNTVMDATLYTGTLLSNSITNAAGFKPDLVWLKSRSAATDHELTDSVRGVTKSLTSNSSAAEATDVQGLTAFNANGFTVGTNTNYNNLSATYVAWQWQAGQGSTSSNTSGTITSTVSVNASAGFSIITYIGNGVNGATVGHGLGVAPTLWIIKRRDGPGDWKALSNVTGSVLMGDLNTQNVWADPGSPLNTAPTSTVITLDSSGVRNGSGQTYVIYAWTPIAGYSAITYFNGNGSTDGPFVYTGFRPKFTLSKDIEGGSYWGMYDSVRSTYNVASARLNADLSNAETTEAVYDYLSNGVKLRSATLNQNNHKHILISFAENPFKNALAR